MANIDDRFVQIQIIYYGLFYSILKKSENFHWFADIRKSPNESTRSNHVSEFLKAFVAAIDSSQTNLIAAAAPHSGDFLHAIPRSAIGTRLDDTFFRIAVSLRLGATMCAPHTCVCGAQVDCSSIHGLACRKSAGRHMRHNAVNDLIKRALASADIPALLEPKSLSRDDGKRPDGLIVLPWANGRCLVWDFTCPDTQPVT